MRIETNKISINKRKFSHSLCVVICFLLIGLISACDNGQEPVPETGAIGFNLEIPGVKRTLNMSRSVSRSVTEDCDAFEITTVEVLVYDESGENPVASGSWPCSASSGTLVNVPPGQNMTVVVLLKNIDGDVKYRGEKSGIDVQAGETTDAGMIGSSSFIPVYLTPATVSNGEVRLTIQPVSGATQYHVRVYKNRDLSGTPIIDEKVSDTLIILSSINFTEDSINYWVIIAYDAYGNKGASPKVVLSSMPKITGMNEEDATITVKEGGNDPEISIQYECSDTVPKGTIILQKPAAGEVIPVGTPVTFVVSGGSCDVNVPDAMSCEDITTVGLECNLTNTCSNDIPAGGKINQYPEPDTVVSYGSTVSLELSAGQPIVPNVLHQSQGDAEEQIQGTENISIGKLSFECSLDYEDGTVINQTPGEGPTECGTQINLVISEHPEIPDVVGMLDDEAHYIIEQAEYVSIGRISNICSNEVEQGHVISQTVRYGDSYCEIYLDLQISYRSQVWYVIGGERDPGDGTSWSQAFNTIHDALNAANDCDEIWVARGSYSPFNDNFGLDQIEITKQVSIYGGFIGEEIVKSERDWVNNLTTVYAGYDTNCFYISADAVIDGFIILNGGSYGQNLGGGGMYIENASPTIANCFFERNSGAIYANNASPAIYNCVFLYNSANEGGAIFNQHSSTTISNCTFAINSAEIGSDIYNDEQSEVRLLNSILWHTDDENIVSLVENRNNSKLSIGHTNIMGGWEKIGKDGTSEVINLGGNINADPQFVIFFYSSEFYDLSLMPTSPCIGAGNNSFVSADITDMDGDRDTSELVPYDLIRNTRLFDDPSIPDTGQGTPPIVDMGAIERQAHIMYVDQENGNLDHSGKSWQEPLPSINDAIKMATNGSEIWVKRGEYRLSDTININRPIALFGGFNGEERNRGERDWYGNKTILNAINEFRCISVTSIIALIDGFTISNGHITGGSGGGIYGRGHYLAISNCNFTDNTAESSDGVGGNGGAIYNDLTAAIITNCIFNNNFSTYYGGAIYNRRTSPIITNCTFFGNTASDSGGAIYNADSSPTITNSIFWNNRSKSGPNIFSDEVSNPIVNFCDIEYSNGVYPGINNINADPRFQDIEMRDFHILPDSPCRDKGSNEAPSLPVTDFEGDFRIIDGQADMGADEYR